MTISFGSWWIWIISVLFIFFNAQGNTKTEPSWYEQINGMGSLFIKLVWQF